MTAFLAMILLLVPVGDERDALTLNNGKVVRGRVLLETKDRILIRTRGKERWFALEEVREVESVGKKMRRYLAEASALREDAVDQRAHLAEELKKQGLDHEAWLEAWLVLEKNPIHPEAHRILGHRKKKDAWQYPYKNGWVRYDKLMKLRANWGNAWVIPTQHFEIRTNLDIYTAARLARDLETFYAGVYAFLADMQLREVIEPIKIYAFRNAEDAPGLGSFVGAYFDTQDRTVYVINRDGKRPEALFHEAAHAILIHSVEFQDGGTVPPWIDEGLALLLESKVHGDPGKLRFAEEVRRSQDFGIMRGVKKTFSLKGILNFNRSVFQASSRQAERYAACYTLVHYLMHGEEERFRTGFFEMLRACRRGQATSSKFDDFLGATHKAVEQGWQTYLGR